MWVRSLILTFAILETDSPDFFRTQIKKGMMVKKWGSWKLCIKETVKTLSKNVCVLTTLKQNLYEVEVTFQNSSSRNETFLTEVLKGERKNKNLPSYVYKQVFCSFVNMEYFISKQSQARAALKCKLPKVQSRSITI